MSTTPPRRPSTLAAGKFAAAQRPLGWAPDPRATARPGTDPMTGSARPARSDTGGSRAPAARRDTGGSRAPAAKKVVPQASRDEREKAVVSGLVATFVLLAITIASVRVSGNMRVDRSRTAIAGTLKQVHVRQAEFRLINQRYASWRELQARGLRLPPKQKVVASNASMSHWFMSVRDATTGVTCSRTGELFDEGPDARKATCDKGSP